MALAGVRPGARPVRGRLAGLERHEAPSAAVRRLESWAWERDLGFDVDVLWAGTSLEAGVMPLVTRVCLHEHGSALGHGTGKGFGVQSLASGMYEALEDFAAFRTESSSPAQWACFLSEPSSHCTRVAASALPSALVEQDALARLIRRSGAREIPAFRMTEVVKVLDPDRESTGTLLWPAALLDLTYIPPEDSPEERVAYRYCSTNGIASGLSPAETILHGLNEINERDALGAFLLDVARHEPHGQSIELERGTESSHLVACIQDGFRTEVELRRLRSVWGNVVVALSEALDSRGCSILGSGASWNLSYAAERALLELAQNLVAEDHDPPHADGMLDSLDRLHPFRNLVAAARLDRVPPSVGTIVPDVPVPVDVVQQVRKAVRELSVAGFTPFARALLRTSQRSDPVPQVWQVVIPGFERFHLVRAGLPVEPTGRLRTPLSLALAREREVPTCAR